VRVRVLPGQRHPSAMLAFRERLDQALGPGTRVQVSPGTGSVLVHYDRDRHSGPNVLELLRDFGILIEDTAVGVGLEIPEGAGGSTTSTRIVDAVADLDRQLSLLTGRKIDLKLLFPAALGGIGLWRVATSGLGLTEVPAYVLLWYAFDSFWKFHREPTKSSGVSPNGHPASDPISGEARASG
jgi:hypothetical protein